jgi:endonuclease YncB( thermonuclease family)
VKKLIINIKKILIALNFLILSCALLSADAKENLKGNVVKIIDGDTLDVNVDSSVIRIRLADIDAPERSQPWGLEAKKFLATKVLKKEVQILITNKDRYGRQIGNIYLGNTDINELMVLKGHAWAYRKYLHNKNLIESENKARKASIGLWHKNDAIPPWDWRKGVRENTKIF